jgi:hypothetical protein
MIATGGGENEMAHTPIPNSTRAPAGIERIRAAAREQRAFAAGLFDQLRRDGLDEPGRAIWAWRSSATPPLICT